MKSVSGKTLCKIVEKNGWVLKRVSGSHHIYSKTGIRAILSIPVHGNKDLPIGTLKGILKDADLSLEDIS